MSYVLNISSIPYNFRNSMNGDRERFFWAEFIKVNLTHVTQQNNFLHYANKFGISQKCRMKVLKNFW